MVGSSYCCESRVKMRTKKIQLHASLCNPKKLIRNEHIVEVVKNVITPQVILDTRKCENVHDKNHGNEIEKIQSGGR